MACPSHTCYTLIECYRILTFFVFAMGMGMRVEHTKSELGVSNTNLCSSCIHVHPCVWGM